MYISILHTALCRPRRALLALLLLAALPVRTLSAQDLALVAHEEGAPEAFELEDVREVFRAKQLRWGGGTKINLAMVKSTSPIAEVVAERVFDMSVDEVKKFWVQIVFRGKASTPKYFSTEEEVLRYVASTPGAVGIVSAAHVEAVPVRVVPVDGQRAW